MNEVVDGVVIPAEMAGATLENKQAYAAGVKRTNAAFVKIALSLEGHVERIYGPDEAARILDRG